MRHLRGKTALVTGAAGGIGRAIALRLADEGVRVCLLDLNAQKLMAVACEVRARGVEALVRQCDLCEPDEIAAAVKYLHDHWDGLDLLINNAGITYYGRMHLMSTSVVDRMLAINVRAPIQLTREVLPTFLARGEGHIVNMASVFGLVGLARLSVYSASKFALMGYSEAIRAEYARMNIGVTAVCPGFVDTGLFENALRGKDRKTPMHPPKLLLATPEKVADRAVRGILRNQPLVIFQPYVRAAWWGKRFVPWLYDWANGFRRHANKAEAPKETVDHPPARRAA